MKKAGLSLIREKFGTLALFFRVLGVFVCTAPMGTGTSYARRNVEF